MPVSIEKYDVLGAPHKMNPAYALSGIFAQISTFENKQSMTITFTYLGSELSPVLSEPEMKLSIIAKFEQVIDSILYLRLKPEKIQSMISQVKDIRNKFIFSMNLTNVADFNANFQIGTSTSLIDAFGHAIDASEDFGDTDLDRAILLSSTAAVLEQVALSKLPDYARRVLELKLNSLMRIVTECTYLSDEDVRRRVKAIYADYCAEYIRHDRTYEELGEKLLRWAKNLMPTGILALALTADASTVVGLLAPPKE